MPAANRRVTGPAPVPWPTEGLWAEAQAALRRSLAVGRTRLAPARGHAEAIAHYRDCLDNLFDHLTPATCGICRDPCCRQAKVWLDFTDLLFLHLNRELLPPHQLRRNPHEACRFLGPQGCSLPHRSRPWICSWYICPDLYRAIARDIPGGGVRADDLRTRIKSLRTAMETAYLRALGV